MTLLRRVALAFIALALAALTGGYFLFKRADIPYAALERTYAHPADKFVELPSGVRMHYRDQGKADGPAIILIHGIGGDGDTWESWVPDLGVSYRLISIDLPGHGLTRAPKDYAVSIPAYADLVDEFATAIGLTHFTIIGNSMGGNVAWIEAANHPEHVDALVLVDAAGWRAPRGAIKIALYKAIADSPLAALIDDLDPALILSRSQRAMHANPTTVSDDRIAHDAALARVPGHRAIILDLFLKRGEEANATPAKLKLIKARALILWGDQDQIIAPADADKFAAAIPNAKVITIPGAGHQPQEENPRLSAAAVSAFLNQTFAMVRAAQKRKN